MMLKQIRAMKLIRRLFGVLALVLPVGSLFANNTTSVFSPEVKEDSSAFEYRFSFLPDGDQALAHRFHYERALNDAWRWRIIGQFSETTGDFEYRYARLELQWQFLESEIVGWDSAFRFEFQAADGDDRPSRGRVAWTGKWNFDSGLELRGNFLTGRQFGAESGEGFLLETRAQATIPVTDKLRFGVEMFNDMNDTETFGSFNTQEHTIGPVIKMSLGDDLKLLGSYLFGISDAADSHDLRLHLTWSF